MKPRTRGRLEGSTSRHIRRLPLPPGPRATMSTGSPDLPVPVLDAYERTLLPRQPGGRQMGLAVAFEWPPTVLRLRHPPLGDAAGRVAIDSVEK